MNSYLAEAATFLVALWIPGVCKILVTDLAIAAVILVGYFGLRRMEHRICAPTDFKWTERHHRQ